MSKKPATGDVNGLPRQVQTVEHDAGRAVRIVLKGQLAVFVERGLDGDPADEPIPTVVRTVSPLFQLDQTRVKLLKHPAITYIQLLWKGSLEP